MVRVLGSSFERVPLPDLKDVVYYRQNKEYTDHEYETSKDLRKAIEKGKLTLLSREEAIRGSIASGTSVDIGAEIKAAIRDHLGVSSSTIDSRQIAREIAPIVAEMVRQEMSRIPLMTVMRESVMPTVSKSTFTGPEYVPTVTTEGMSANITAKNTETSGDAANDALAALRRMRTGT